MLAWLHADEERTGELPDMPAYGGHLVEWLAEIGLTDFDRPHSYANLTAWAQHIQLTLTAWELTTMQKLSSVYVSSLRDYSQRKDAPPPHINIEQQRANVASKLRAMREAAKRG